MTPLHIQLLIQLYSNAKPDAKSEAAIDYTNDLSRLGLIYSDLESGSGYHITVCGEKFIERLLATPIAL